MQALFFFFEKNFAAFSISRGNRAVKAEMRMESFLKKGGTGRLLCRPSMKKCIF